MDINITKGEWIIDSSFYDSYSNMWITILKNKEGKAIQRIYGITKEESEANAKLISASPKMYEALLNLENDNGIIPESIWDMRNEALKIAKG